MIIQQSSGHSVRQIQEGLWQVTFHFPASTNCWIFLDTDGLVLIDAANPWNAATILSIIEQLGRPLRRIVITHAHPDHAGSAAELARRTGALVYAHENDRRFLDGSSSMADTPGFWLCRGVLQMGQFLGMLNPPAVNGLVIIGDAENIGSLQVIHTPGHTPGSISLWSEEAGAIFCGDNLFAVFNTLRIGLPWFTLDLKTQAESIKRYTEFPARLLLSGHGPVFRCEDLSLCIERVLEG